MKPDPIILDGHKLKWHAERVNAWLGGERIAPITIDCALTRACTYRCVYCYGKLQENKCQPITRKVILQFLDDAADIGVKAISFVSDGESTCSPYLYEAIIHGRNNGMDMALGTNGYLLEDNRLEEILPALTYLRFNISAAVPGRYAAIHGCGRKEYDKVIATIRKAVKIKKKLGIGVTIGLQMVLLPDYGDQIIPLARLGEDLGVDYLVVKHCSDDEKGRLGVDYGAYRDLTGLLRQAESISTDTYLVKAKWSKILSGGKRHYSQCHGPPFLLQMSGSGLIAPCGMLFNERYKRFHMGNITEQSFKEIWKSKRYWDVMAHIASAGFDARHDCGTLCLQHKVNEFLFRLKREGQEIQRPHGREPMHINFV